MKKSLANKMAELEHKETDNAIFTLNTMYFFKCAEKQGMDKNGIKREIAKKLNVNENHAEEIVYKFAANYFSYEKIMSCVEYIVSCEKGEIKIE